MGLFERPEAEAVEVAGKTMRCEICGHTRFWERKAQLHTAVASFFSLEWLTGSSARCVVCERCGYIHWFLPLE